MAHAYRRSLFASAVLAAVAAPAAAQARSPLNPPSVFIPFANMQQGQTELTASPQLRVGFNGGSQITFTMDTGSTGIVVSPDNFTPPQGSTPIGTGTITYTSTGIVLTGNFYETEVQIGSGTATATAKVPVLQVLVKTCLEHARNCTPATPPTNVAMFGVGFGQEAAGQPDGTPDKNPFLNIFEMNGHRVNPAAGYVLTAKGVTLGISPKLARRFRKVPLTWNTTNKDWDRAPLTLKANGWTGTGTVLMDTGVGSMYLTPPVGDTVPTVANASATGPCIQYGPCAAQGVVITVTIGVTGATPGASYTFKVGPNGIPDTKQKAAPDWVTVDTGTTSSAFVNTTYHFLNRFDYLYDFTFGEVGFRSASAK